MKKKSVANLIWLLEILAGCAMFALGFDLFLDPNDINIGGVSGVAMVLVYVMKIGTVGLVSALLNVPLLLLGGKKIGARFLAGTLIGAAASSVMLDLFARIPTPEVEPLLAAVYGGLLAGAGLGLVFLAGASTGGSDILVRLLKRRWRNVPVGKITMATDLFVAVLTGVVFGDITKTLYSGVALFACSKVIDAVVYSFDYSKVALIITPKYSEVAAAIVDKLDRGVTYLEGQGYYSGRETRVILTAVKKQQLAELKELVTDIDPDAFVILQEAHQVLGDGFARYSADQL